MPLRKKNKSTSSLNRRPKPLSREKQRLKDLEDGFNTWNPERLKEYDPFQDGNMRTYFTTKTVRKVLLDKGIIKDFGWIPIFTWWTNSCCHRKGVI